VDVVSEEAPCVYMCIDESIDHPSAPKHKIIEHTTYIHTHLRTRVGTVARLGVRHVAVLGDRGAEEGVELVVLHVDDHDAPVCVLQPVVIEDGGEGVGVCWIPKREPEGASHSFSCLPHTHTLHTPRTV
jgi:hypothetical protein